MSEALKRILHRLAALGLLLAVIGLAVSLFVMPLVHRFDALRSEIATEREQLARFEAFAANKDAAKALTERSAAAIRSGLFLPGETDALRTASLQAVITEVAEKQGVRLTSAHALPVHERDGLRFIGVQAELDADIRQLQALILAFESRRPYLFIQSLQVAPVAGRRQGSDDLKVRFGIVGAVQAEGEAKL
ncbi:MULTISPECIES: type II secretion system protein GspM [Rhodomicrobium]|uniref:type II secretion system protein GspM n=1 Tax=Rhodomicrobium TaxID=1068 RepID=UPI000B4AEFE9|nr:MULTISPECIES: type II secretion system protein GspM [Rhodomicrobium]